MATPTPTPWTAKHDNDTGPSDDGYREFWRVASGEFSTKEDAELCVRAVNNHDELVAELHAMVEAYRDDCDDEDRPSMVRRALALLAKLAP